MNSIQYKDEIGNQMLCKKEKMWKRVCEARYSVALSVLEEPHNAMPRQIADLITAKGDATIYRLYDVAYTVIVFSLECI